MMQKKPRGRPPLPCDRISLTSKRCRDREAHPYMPYRCKCETRPKKPVKKVAVKKSPGRPRVVNWSRDGLPTQFVKLFKNADRQVRMKERHFIQEIAKQKKQQLLEFTRRNSGTLIEDLTPRERNELDKLLKINPTTFATLERFTKRVETWFDTQGERMNEVQNSRRPNRPTRKNPSFLNSLNSGLGTRPTRKDPSCNSRLGAYWRPTGKRQRRVPARFT